MLNMFCGFDAREAAGYHTFCASVINRSTVPVAFIPMASYGMPQGTNAFTLSRFLIPYSMDYEGRAVFMDASDMICLADVAELHTLLNQMPNELAVSVVKHEYKTKHKIKYIETPMESPNVDYARKNWASMMLVNCEHPGWRELNPSTILSSNILSTLQFNFLNDAEIGSIDKQWNVLVDEGQDSKNAKILHWTAGIPAFDYYKKAPCADLWRKEWERATSLFHIQ